MKFTIFTNDTFDNNTTASHENDRWYFPMNNLPYGALNFIHAMLQILRLLVHPL